MSIVTALKNWRRSGGRRFNSYRLELAGLYELLGVDLQRFDQPEGILFV
jgi:hypothetical protein